LYTNELKNDIDIIEYVQLYELAIILENTHLVNRLKLFLGDILTTANFAKGYVALFGSENNKHEKMNDLTALFENFYFRNKNEITGLNSDTRKTLECITKCNWEILMGPSDFSLVIKQVKSQIWKSKEYSDISLLCKDGVKIEVHRAVICLSPLFKHFHSGVDLHEYPVQAYTSTSLILFLNMLYLGSLFVWENEDISLENWSELFHLCEQSGINNRSLVLFLKSKINERTCSEMLDFCFDVNLEDKEFWTKIQECMNVTPHYLCSMYLMVCQKYPSLLERVVEWMVFHVNEQTSTAWLVALDENGIEDIRIWAKIESVGNPDTLNLWNTLQGKIAKQRDLVEELEKDNTDRKRKREEDENKYTELEKSYLERIENLEKKLKESDPNDAK
jgi:hypothetical protein